MYQKTSNSFSTAVSLVVRYKQVIQQDGLSLLYTLVFFFNFIFRIEHSSFIRGKFELVLLTVRDSTNIFHKYTLDVKLEVC
jgi:hypothetical protein